MCVCVCDFNGQVDVLFEEERGFWPAVYEIIETTKRPVIMTCTGEGEREGGRGERELCIHCSPVAGDML